MTWQIIFSSKAAKQSEKLNPKVLSALRLLVEDLKHKGPAINNDWPNYGKLLGKKNEDKRHCHLIKGKPTYVCCWEVVDKKIKIIEVYYVGTHESAPY
jgi:mRNA-degrading endonuclease RelE of RelBE toxin-antitoxin system